MSVVKPKANYNSKSQSEERKMRKGDQVVIGDSFACDWLRE